MVSDVPGSVIFSIVWAIIWIYIAPMFAALWGIDPSISGNTILNVALLAIGMFPIAIVIGGYFSGQSNQNQYASTGGFQ